MKAPLISIITPIYNVETRLIDRLLDSLYATDLNADLFEILLVDDGSDPAIDLRDLSHGDASNIQLFRQDNQGLGAARNVAIPKARGEYLYFVDADDYLFSENLNALIRQIRLNPADLTIVEWEKVRSKEIVLPRKRSNHLRKWSSGTEYGRQNHWKGGIARYLFHRKMVEEHSLLFPEGVWHEDELFITKAFFYAQSVLETRLPVYAYYVRNDSITQKKGREATLRRVHDRMTALRDVHCWIKTLPQLQPAESTVLYKKRDFLVVDFFISLCKESLPYKDFVRQYYELTGLNFLPLPDRNYGYKYKLFRIISRNPRLLYLFSPILKNILKA